MATQRTSLVAGKRRCVRRSGAQERWGGAALWAWGIAAPLLCAKVDIAGLGGLALVFEEGSAVDAALGNCTERERE
jgi:hypothetical protein